jgi:hypothetical protein
MPERVEDSIILVDDDSSSLMELTVSSLPPGTRLAENGLVWPKRVGAPRGYSRVHVP